MEELQRLQVENSNLEKRLALLKSGIIAKVQKEIQMELDGIVANAKRIDSEHGKNILSYVENIHQVFTHLKTDI